MSVTTLVKAIRSKLNTDAKEVKAVARPNVLTHLMATRKGQLKYAAEGEQLIGLNLANTGLTDQQWTEVLELIDLTKIEALNLNGNKLESLTISKEFGSLKYLEVSNNELLKSIDFENSSSSLERLVVVNNNLSKLKLIEGASNLKYLDASKNNIEEVDLDINLLRLEFINLSQNKLSSVEFGLQLSSLKYVYLFKNEQLKRLNFAAPPRELEILHLDQCGLEHLPHNLTSFTNLQSLYLYKNPLPDLPQTIIGDESSKNCSDGVLSYLREYNKGTQINERVKVILVGNGRVGKTSMLRRLRHLPFREKEEYTHGIQLGLLDKKKLPEVKTPGLMASVWDFGGQEIFYATHQFFLTEEALYVLAWTDEENVKEYRERDANKLPDDDKYQTKEYWLENIRQHGGDQCPVLMVQTHFDRKSIQINAKDFEDQYGVQCLDFSAATDHGLDALRKTIMKQLNNQIPFFGKDFPETYDKVISAIESLSRSNSKISLDYFKNEICDKANIDKGGELDLLEFLRKTGIVVWFKNIDSLKNIIFIDPDWITTRVYRLINNELSKENGEINQAFINTWLGDMNAEEQKQFMELLVGFGLIFEDGPGEYVAPQYLPENLSDRNAKKALGGIEENLELIFSFQFPKFVPDNVMINFLSKYGPYSNDMIWKNGICFKNKEGQYCKVVLNGNSLEVYTINNEQNYPLQGEVCKAFIELSKKANAVVILKDQCASWQGLKQAKEDGLTKYRDKITGKLVGLEHFSRFFEDRRLGVMVKKEEAIKKPEIFFFLCLGGQRIDW